MSDVAAQYREAKAALPAHVEAWGAAEQALLDWLRAHRGVPSNKLYDPKTGDPVDPEHQALEAAVTRAFEDQLWVRALIVACGEAVKGEPFDDVFARNEGGKHRVMASIREVN